MRGAGGIAAIAFAWIRAGFYALEASALYVPGLGAYGCRAAISGRFWRFFGPECELLWLGDSRDGLLLPRAGINLSLVQWDYLNIDLYFQGVWMRGLLDRDGFAGGIRLRSFPGAGLVLEARLGGQDYGSFALGDSELRLGWMRGRVEIGAGYRWLGSGLPDASGPFAGARLWL